MRFPEQLSGQGYCNRSRQAESLNSVCARCLCARRWDDRTGSLPRIPFSGYSALIVGISAVRDIRKRSARNARYCGSASRATCCSFSRASSSAEICAQIWKKGGEFTFRETETERLPKFGRARQLQICSSPSVPDEIKKTADQLSNALIPAHAKNNAQDRRHDEDVGRPDKPDSPSVKNIRKGEHRN